MTGLIRILVVDDDAVLLKAALHALGSAGYETLAATDGPAAMELARTHRPDLLLLDVNMPGMDGIEVCRKIKVDPDLAEIIVILLSGSITDSDSQSVGLDAGADGYITRPIPNRELLARLQSILRLKSAQKDLKKSETLFKLLEDHMRDVVWLMDLRENCFLYVSPSVFGLRGYTPEEVMAQPVEASLTPQSLESVAKWTVEAITLILAGKGDETHSPYFVEQPCKDGSTVWTEVVADYICDDAGFPIQVVGLSRDITERRQAEKLQDAIYRIAQAADQAGSLDSLYSSIHSIIREVMLADNFFIALVDELSDLLSFPYACDEIDPPPVPKKPGKGLTEYVLRTGRSLLCDQLLFQHLQTSGEVELIGAASPIWLGVPLIIAERVIGVMAVQDYRNARAYGERERRILEFVSSQVAMAINRKQTEQALLESSDRHRIITQTALDGFWLMDLQGCLLEVNETYCRMSGYSAQELLRKSVPELEAIELSAETAAHTQKVIEQGQDRFESRHRRKDGSIYDVEISVHFLPNKGGRLVAFIQDITQRKQAERTLQDFNTRLESEVESRTRQLHQAQEQLVRQEKLAVLGQMAGSVGHELRTPLSVINNAIYYLKLVQPDAEEKVRQHHTLIEQEIHNADKIISDLLDFARIKSVERQPGSIPELIHNVLARFPVPASVKTTLKIPADLPEVLVDPRQMEQVLGNLVTNACQSMPEGGKLTISAKPQEGFVLIAVKDTGTGITPENMLRLFEPLFTTKKRGIGLGLPVSQKLIEANGGRLEVESEPNRGSTFTLVLPVDS
jgi:PAS domain S-box-containing protein